MPTSPQARGYYILIVTKTEFEPITPGDEIARTLLGQGIWLASRLMPYQREYRPGDQVLIYSAGRGARFFVGDATVGGPFGDAPPAHRKLGEGMGLDGYDKQIPLSRVRLWPKEVPLTPLVERLDFIGLKRYYGLYFRQAAKRLGREDYLKIMTAAGMKEPR